ncbi:MAG: single-stranded-DNA-specific exonuclease RecJ [Clostridiales bacterium]|jgi:single-stranded-DNA-specific exonuclease|nr:single-stranded-DNA-specific exonuclease RecJ [Clostridiales bacterium]
MRRWILRENDANIDLMAGVLKISPILCRILANRGIRTKNTAIRYLNPILGYLHDTAKMLGIAEAVDIIRHGIAEGAKFCIFGDYDVDGVSATVILRRVLAQLGADCGHYIPHRIHEGYGLNLAAIEQIADEYQVLIAVDNGISAVAEVARAAELGLKVIILDHHQPATEAGAEILPPAHAIINPKQAACPYPFKELCAAGIAYKFALHLCEEFGKSFEAAGEALIFATIATFCDVVDLVDENRIIAKNGLRLLTRQNTENSINIGLNALVKARNLEYNSIDDFAIGFILGPCINASGRLDSAGLAVRLFLSEDEAEAEELADKLAALNDERKDLCAKFVDEAIKNLPEDLDDVPVIYIPEIHESISGIVAGRIKEHTGRPTLVIARSGEVAKGSARSIEAYNIFEEMQKCKDLFLRFGGHKMAAGVTLPIENIDLLRKRLNAASQLAPEDFLPIIFGEAWLDLDEITFELAQEIAALSPFGKANREPAFFTRGIFTERAEIIGKSGETLRLTFRSEQGRKITAVAFKSVEKFIKLLEENYSEGVAQGFAARKTPNLHIKLDIAYNIRINTYMGNSSLQLVIMDFKGGQYES